MRTHFQLDELTELARSQTEAEFVESLGVPLFHVEHKTGSAGTERFMTNRGETSEIQRLDLFFPLRKRQGANGFTSMVTVGRAGNNDVVLQGDGVSKFHAYFMRIREDWILVDAGSTLGTFVAGRELEPRKERAPMTSGIEIRLGNVLTGRFLQAADCHRQLL